MSKLLQQLREDWSVSATVAGFLADRKSVV